MRHKTFFSFSSRDAFVPRLLTRLQAQNLNIWDYSVEGDEIPGGETITPYLRDRVGQSTLFLPVVSPNSLRSPFTKAEVDCALARHAECGLRIIPLVETSAIDIVPWPEPYADLRKLRYHSFGGEVEDRRQMEDAIARVCQDVGVPYMGLVADTPRLPLMERTDRELLRRVPRDTERANILYARLDMAIRTCKIGLEQGDYARALSAIEYFIAMVENEYEGDAFYYPYLVRAVCLIAVGRLPDSAQALTVLRIHPEREESLYGLLGYIRQAQGLFAEAASLYRESLRRDPHDPAAATGVVVNEALAGEPLCDLPEACRVIEFGRYLSEDERELAQEALALGMARMGQSDRAAAILFDRIRDRQASAVTYINLANVLVDLRRHADARDILMQAWQLHLDDFQIGHHLMRFLLDLGRDGEAVAIARQATELMPDRPDIWFERLLIERRAGCDDAANTAARLASMLPKMKEDFYYTGYANWVIGSAERAAYDLERSGESGDYASIDRSTP
jgi:tetratricopeptide (TPR) repeat protein